MELNVEQKRALAMAAARARLQGTTPGVQTEPEAVPEVSVAEDVAKSAVAGVARGALSIPGAAGDIANVGSSIGDWATKKLFGENTDVQQAIDLGRKHSNYNPLSTDDIQGGVEKVTGKFYEPQTRAGKFVRTGTEFAVGGALSAPKKAVTSAVKFGLAPGVASEAAGQATEGTAIEPYARVTAALLGGVASDKAHRSLMEALTQSDLPELSGIPTKARRYAEQTVADPARRAAMEADMARLGPEAMLADVSPEWMGVARGAASRPSQRDTVVNALLRRDDARNPRLAADLDRSLGPAPVPSQVEAGLEGSRAALSPEYERAFQGARAVNTQQLADHLDTMAVNLRGPGQIAARRVRDMLNIPGNAENLDPYPDALLQTRQAIDGMLAGEQNPQVVRVLTDARRQVDETLATSVPGVKDADAKFAELARQSEGLQRGTQLLDSGKTAIRPQELQDEFPAAAQPQGTQVGPSAVPVRMRQGARAEIDRVAGTNANDPAALQRLVKGEGDWNRDKLRTVFGREAADDALSAIDRETRFYRTAGRVGAGSDTAMAQRFGDFLDEAATPNRIPTDTTITGGALRTVQRIAQSLARTNSEAKADRFAESLGRLSVARGPERDAAYRAIVESLTRRQGRSSGEARAMALLLAGSQPIRAESGTARPR